MSDLEYLEIIESGHVCRLGVYPIMRKGQNLEIDQFIGYIGKRRDIVL